MPDSAQPLIYHTTSTLISASAGTGKTYQLVSRYIALLMLGVAPEKIIALTFTRKAAGEFRGRILHALAEGACDLRDKKTRRNLLAARVWEVWSGLTTPAQNEWKKAANDVPLLPATVAVVKRAAAENTYPEDLYAKDAELQAYLQLPQQDAQEFASLLRKVVMAMSKLELSTIDSFFNSLVAGNCLELGVNNVSSLDPADEKKARRDTIHDYLDARTAETEKREAFLNMFADLTGGKGGKTINRLEKELQTYLSLYRENPVLDAWHNTSYFAEQSHTPFTIATAEDASEWHAQANKLRNLLLRYSESDFSSSVYSGLKKLAAGALPLSSTLKKWLPEKPMQHAHFISLLSRLSRAFEQQLPMTHELQDIAQEAEMLAASLFQTKADKEALSKLINKTTTSNYKSTKETKRIAAYVAAMEQDGISAIIDTACYLRDRLPAKCLYDATARTRSLFSLLRDYADAYETRLTTTGQFSFDDIARKARELMTKEYEDENVDNAAFCREHVALRTGKKYIHWMLDEFQDTSDAQFDTLTPVLQFLLGDSCVPFTTDSPRPLPASVRPYHEDCSYYVAEGSLFVVGDDKQGIYGFRTGDTQAFRKLKTEREWSDPVYPAHLTQSFRSARAIMGKNGFVNTLFRNLQQIENNDAGANSVAMEHYTHHETAKASQGYVEMQVVAAEKEGDDAEDKNVKTRAYEAISSILKRLTIANKAPINGMSIGILTRTNSEAEATANHLRNDMPELPILLVKDTLAAVACPLGEMLHHLFRWLSHPHEQTSLSVLKASFMAYLFEKAGSDSATWESLRELLELHGYAHLLEQILENFPMHILTAEQQEAHRHLIATWLSTARAFDATGGTLPDWLNRISTLSAQGVASSRYVQIMTMHKSKGLEFDAVILPFLSDDAIDSESDLHFYRTPDGNAILLAPANKDVRSEFWPGAFDELTLSWKQRQSQDEYNLLYVATTRARFANYILLNGGSLIDSKTNKPNQRSRSISGLIRRAFEGDTAAYKTTSLLSTPVGDSEWYTELAPKDTANATPPTPTAPLGAAIPRRMRKSPSSLAKAEDKQKDEPEDSGNHSRVNNGGLSATDFGTKVHTAWEEISWLDSPLPRWMNEGEPRNKAQEVVYEALKQPEIAALFTARPGQEVYNEQPIEAITKDGEWLSGTIDRLVITHDAAGNITAAHIIDFKTNRPGPKEGYTDFYAWLREHYEAQMVTYREHVATALAIPESAVSLSLISCPLREKARVVPYEATES